MKKYLILISLLLFLVGASVAYYIQNTFFQSLLISMSTTFFSIAVTILVVNNQITTMPWLVFALTGGCVLIIALLTMSTQAIKAALANPVDSLKYE